MGASHAITTGTSVDARNPTWSDPAMFIEASDHGCPHLRETRRAEAAPTLASPARAECPFGTERAAPEPLRSVSASAGIVGWWAYCSQADLPDGARV